MASYIGRPLATDKLTATKERLAYARMLVEVEVNAENCLGCTGQSLLETKADSNSYPLPFMNRYGFDMNWNRHWFCWWPVAVLEFSTYFPSLHSSLISFFFYSLFDLLVYYRI